MSKLKQNLQYSKDACAYVLKAISLGGANWDQYRGSSNSWETCIQSNDEKACAKLKNPVDVCLYDKLRPQYKTKLSQAPTALDRIKIMADETKKMQCGNCGEFAALAFTYLYEKKILPLDYMSLIGGDHAFIVIGRLNNNPKIQNVNDPLTWGSDAVVCDPWGRGFRNGDVGSGTYPTSEFVKRMGGLVHYSGIQSLYREA